MNVRRPAIIAIWIIAIACLAWGVFEYRSQLGLVPASDAPRNTASTAANAGVESGPVAWKTVDRAMDGFELLMPADANEVLVPAFTSAGGQVSIQMLQANIAPETTYAVAWADNPPVVRATQSGTEHVFDTARDGALARIQASLTTESRGSTLGYPSRDFSGQNAGGGLLTARMILVGSRLYMLIATFPSAGAWREDDVSKFFASFRLASAQSH